MHRWDDKNVCHSVIRQKSSIRHCNELLTMKTTTNTVKIKKFRRKVREEFWGHLNHMLFSENIIYDPLNVFSTPKGDIKTKIV